MMNNNTWILISVGYWMISGVSSYAYDMTEKVVIGNELIAVIKSSAGNITSVGRVERINERYAEIVAKEDLSADNIYISAMDNNRVIMIGTSVLITITEKDAIDNNSSIDDLSAIWLANCRRAIPKSRPN